MSFLLLLLNVIFSVIVKILKRKKKLSKKRSLAIDRTNTIQDKYFLCDHSNIVKTVFKTKLNKYALIFVTVSYISDKEGLVL